MNASSNITTSRAAIIIRQLSSVHNQTGDMKRAINRSVTNTGHGSIFLGSSSRLKFGDTNIRILVGAHFSRHGKLKIGIFGGKCEQGEETIDTMIRETIEEIFNFRASPLMIHYIKIYLNDNPNLYYIHQMGNTHTAYSYFFDVSMLGVFIKIIKSIPTLADVVLLIPTSEGLSNIENFLATNIRMRDLSSFDGPYSEGIETTINLVEFMRTRYISERLQRRYRQMGIHRQPGLDEVKYLSFASLNTLVEAASKNKKYYLLNFAKNRREHLEMQNFLVNILQNFVFSEIIAY